MYDGNVLFVEEEVWKERDCFETIKYVEEDEGPFIGIWVCVGNI